MNTGSAISPSTIRSRSKQEERLVSGTVAHPLPRLEGKFARRDIAKPYLYIPDPYRQGILAAQPLFAF